MKKVGFIIKQKVKVKNKEYEYYNLRRSDRLKDKGTIKYQKRDTNIYKFGNKKNALEKLLIWESNMELFPSELKDMGFNLDDVRSWREQIEIK